MKRGGHDPSNITTCTLLPVLVNLRPMPTTFVTASECLPPLFCSASIADTTALVQALKTPIPREGSITPGHTPCQTWAVLSESQKRELTQQNQSSLVNNAKKSKRVVRENKLLIAAGRLKAGGAVHAPADRLAGGYLRATCPDNSIAAATAGFHSLFRGVPLLVLMGMMVMGLLVLPLLLLLLMLLVVMVVVVVVVVLLLLLLPVLVSMAVVVVVVVVVLRLSRSRFGRTVGRLGGG